MHDGGGRKQGKFVVLLYARRREEAGKREEEEEGFFFFFSLVSCSSSSSSSSPNPVTDRRMGDIASGIYWKHTLGETFAPHPDLGGGESPFYSECTLLARMERRRRK